MLQLIKKPNIIANKVINTNKKFVNINKNFKK